MVIGVQRIAVADFDELVLLPENEDKLLEYIDNEVLEVVSNNRSSRIGARILSYITLYVEENDLGFTTGADGGYRVNGERYIPDCAYISKARQPEPSQEAYNALSPDLAVEVLSPNDKPGKVRIKVTNYMLAGTQLWLIDPEAQQVEVYIPGKKPYTLMADDTLDGGDVLPDFKLALKAIFKQQINQSDEAI
jgi:Uma2 family endonuclease